VVVAALTGVGLPVAVANPARIHAFYKAIGQRAKIDPIDASKPLDLPRQREQNPITVYRPAHWSQAECRKFVVPDQARGLQRRAVDQADPQPISLDVIATLKRELRA
jgi:hypothetical protein